MAGRIQNEDVKTLAELTGAGGSASQLINDTKIYVTANALNKQLSQAITDGDIGGGGGGGINFIVNGNAENATINNFVTYNDGAVSRPIDGTGGAPTITNVSRSIASPILYQNASWRFVKPASNVQGQGWSVPFTVQDGFMAKAIKIRFLYQVVTGTFTAGSLSADSDLIVYLYDVTNSKLIEPTNFKLYSNSSTISDIFEGEFQTSATGTSYRLIFHLATTTTNGWTLAVDEIEVSPSEYIFGTSIGNTTPFTPTLSNNTGVSANTANYRFSGDHIEVNGRVLFNATGAGAEFSVSLPPGMSVDSTKTATVPDETSFGIFQYKDNGVQFRTGNIVYASANTVRFNLDSSTQSILGTGLTSGDTLNYIYRIPIAGLQSSTKMSDGYDGRVVAFDIYKSTTQSIPNATDTKVAFNAIVFDDVGGWDSVNNRYIVRTAGKYAVKTLLSYTGNAAGIRDLQIKINGATRVRVQRLTNGPGYNTGVLGSRNFDLVAGDYIEVFTYQDSGGALNLEAGTQWTYLSVEKINGPTAIAASEFVGARYSTSAGQAVPNGVVTVVNYDTKIWDTHNSVTTGPGVWKFTAPVAGTYMISAVATLTTLTNALTTYYAQLNITGDTSKVKRIDVASSYLGLDLQGAFKLKAGDTIQYTIYQANGATRNLINSNIENTIEIVKVGAF